MSSNFVATDDFLTSIDSIQTLVAFASEEKQKGNEDNRILFLKLAIVSSVTKFQVFIEAILKEYCYYLKTSNKEYRDVSIHLRLNALKLYTSKKLIHKKLENPGVYNAQTLKNIREIALQTLSFCDDATIIDQELEFDTKFPMGKTGLGELTGLFKQVRGEDIFVNPPFDINKLNEILGRRHAIIHEDSNPQITEQTVEAYRDYLLEVITYINNYLDSYR